MNWFIRTWLDRKLKKTLARHGCRLDSGIGGLRGGTLTLERNVKLHDIKVYAVQLRIGAYTDIVSNTELRDVSEIGRYCSVGANCVIGQNRHSHPLHWLSTSGALIGQRLLNQPGSHTLPSSAPAVIEHDVWIGRDVMIMSGVTIGTGAVVGAQSLVTKDVPPYAVVAGSPARVIRYRFDEALRGTLLASKWWEVPREGLVRMAIEDPHSLANIPLPEASGDYAACMTVQSAPFSVRVADTRDALRLKTAITELPGNGHF